MKPSDDFVRSVQMLGILEARELERKMVESELYEHAKVCRDRIEARVDEMLGGLGFEP